MLLKLKCQLPLFLLQDVEERQKYLLNNTRPSTKSLYEEFGFETQFDADENDDLILRNLPTSVNSIMSVINYDLTK